MLYHECIYGAVQLDLRRIYRTCLLINKVCALVNFNFPTQVGIIALNVPAAILCYKHISPRFTFLSCVQFFLVSFFISIFHFEPFFKDQILNVLFGGFLWGFSISLALRAGGSTGGTDFIAQYVSSKIHRESGTMYSSITAQ